MNEKVETANTLAKCDLSVIFTIQEIASNLARGKLVDVIQLFSKAFDKPACYASWTSVVKGAATSPGYSIFSANESRRYYWKTCTRPRQT